MLHAVSHTMPDPNLMAVDDRVEIVASIIGCVLSDAFQMQQGLPHTPMHRLDGAVRRVYESIGRATAQSLLKPEVILTAERRAIEAAADLIDHYEASDEHLGVRVDPQQRRTRIKTAFLSALHAYQREMGRRVS